MVNTKADVHNTDTVIAYKDCSEFSLDNLRYLLDVCPTNIVVIYDEKEPEDYILNSKIRYIKNEGGRCWSKIHNQGIRQTDSQYVILSAWRSRPTEEHFQKVFDNLNKGFAFVDLCLLHFTALNKQVVGDFGLFDDGFKFGHCEDWDFYNRIWAANLGVYLTYEIPELEKVTTWSAEKKIGPFNAENYKYYKSKWQNVGKELFQLKNEVNYSDRKLFREKYGVGEFLSGEYSVIGDHWAKGQCFEAYDKYTNISKISFSI
jgi:hypothetical protein